MPLLLLEEKLCLKSLHASMTCHDKILSINEKIQVRKNPYSDKFYAMEGIVKWCKKTL